MSSTFTPEEQALLDMSDEEIDALRRPAQKGDKTAWNRLYAWAYVSARDYYAKKFGPNADITHLVDDFCTEFENGLPNVRFKVSHWARRLMKIKLKSLGRRREKQRRQLPLHDKYYHLPEPGTPASYLELEEGVQLVFAIFFKHLARQDDEMREAIIRLLRRDKSLGEPNPLLALARKIGLGKYSLSMRYSRFWDDLIDELDQTLEVTKAQKRKRLKREIREFLKELLRKHDDRLDDSLFVLLLLLVLCLSP